MAHVPIPNEVKIAGGTLQPYRDGAKDELVMAKGKVEMPDDLEDEVREVWEAIVPDIIALDVVRTIDVHQLVDMCRWRALWEKWFAELLAMDIAKANVDEKLIARLLRGVDMASDKFFRISQLFGLSPSDRTKLRLDKGNKKKAEAWKRE